MKLITTCLKKLSQCNCNWDRCLQSQILLTCLTLDGRPSLLRAVQRGAEERVRLQVALQQAAPGAQDKDLLLQGVWRDIPLQTRPPGAHPVSPHTAMFYFTPFKPKHCLISHHWGELQDPEGHQCLTCGKVFGSGNRNDYFKHLATHDEDSQ